MHQVDEAHTTLYANSVMLCYKVLPFRLVNVKSTCKRIVKNFFRNMLVQNLQNYVGRMLVNSTKYELHVSKF